MGFLSHFFCSLNVLYLALTKECQNEGIRKKTWHGTCINSVALEGGTP
jgi:hypothetical protein